jgi:uncharacterized protein YjaG (DUF416 family)
MPDNAELIVRLHPANGEDIALWSRDFRGVTEALVAIGAAIDDRRSLSLTHVRYEGDTAESAVVINLANVVSVRVLETEASAAPGSGQYL